MCGRFVASSTPEELGRYFDVDEVVDADSEPSWNVAPTDAAPVVVERDDEDGVRSRVLDRYRWGLVPPWADDLKVGARMINARVETLAERNGFKQALERRRCLVVADAFYEWEKREDRKAKQPWLIRRRDGEPLAFAGLWERWKAKAGPEVELGWVRTCTIVTGPANDDLAPIHHRMPLALPPSAWEAWLDPSGHDPDRLSGILGPPPSGLLELVAVSTGVNDARRKDAGVAEPIPGGPPAPGVEGGPAQGSLLG